MFLRVSSCGAVLAGSLFMVTLTGCGGGAGLPEGETGTVSGHVSFQGQPIPAQSIVMFVGADTGLVGTGVVDSSSDYKLIMRDDSKILVGKYRVTVVPPNPTSNLSQDEIMKLSMENKLPPPPVVKEIPDHYRSPETTPLTFDVKPGDNKYDIEMKPAA